MTLLPVHGLDDVKITSLGAALNNTLAISGIHCQAPPPLTNKLTSEIRSWRSVQFRSDAGEGFRSSRSGLSAFRGGK